MGVTKPRTWHGAARESPPTRNGSTVSRSCRRARKLRRGCIGRRPPGSEGPVRGCRDGPLKGRESAGGAAERFGVPQSGRTCTRWASKRRTGRAEPISALIRPGRVPGVPRNPTRGRAERREANREVSPTLKPLESRHRRRADSFVRLPSADEWKTQLVVHRKDDGAGPKARDLRLHRFRGGKEREARAQVRGRARRNHEPAARDDVRSAVTVGRCEIPGEPAVRRRTSRSRRFAKP